jgi:hypothetical protein
MNLLENKNKKVKCPKSNRLKYSKNCMLCNSQGGQSFNNGNFYLWCDYLEEQMDKVKKKD